MFRDCKKMMQFQETLHNRAFSSYCKKSFYNFYSCTEHSSLHHAVIFLIYLGRASRVFYSLDLCLESCDLALQESAITNCINNLNAFFWSAHKTCDTDRHKLTKSIFNCLVLNVYSTMLLQIATVIHVQFGGERDTFYCYCEILYNSTADQHQ